MQLQKMDTVNLIDQAAMMESTRFLFFAKIPLMLVPAVIADQAFKLPNVIMHIRSATTIGQGVTKKYVKDGWALRLKVEAPEAKRRSHSAGAKFVGFMKGHGVDEGAIKPEWTKLGSMYGVKIYKLENGSRRAFQSCSRVELLMQARPIMSLWQRIDFRI